MLVLLALRVLADDTGDTGDTGPYVDTAARAESVYVQDAGCGGAKAALFLPALLFLRRRA